MEEEEAQGRTSPHQGELGEGEEAAMVAVQGGPQGPPGLPLGKGRWGDPTHHPPHDAHLLLGDMEGQFLHLGPQHLPHPDHLITSLSNHLIT